MQSYLHNLFLFGLLFAISSTIGALSDIGLGILSSKIKYTLYFILGLLSSLVLIFSSILPFNVILIVWIMAVWGVYYEFMQIAVFNYVTRHKHIEEHSRNFGLIYLFENLSYVIGPIIGGFLIVSGKYAIYSVCFACIIIAFLFIRPLIVIHKHKEKPFLVYEKKLSFNFKKELRSFKKIWQFAFIMFIGIFLYNVWDSFVWTLEPLQSTVSNAVFAGIITAIFTLPLATLEAWGGKIADIYGRRITFILGFFIASLFTFLFGLQDNLYLRIILALIAAVGFAFAYPAMMGETSKETSEHEKQLGNIAGLQRIFVNGGYILGPIFAGYVSSIYGIQRAFSILGLVMMFSFIPILIFMTHYHFKGRIHRVLVTEFEL